MVKIYKHSHFVSDAFGHGGNKRTAQIDEILNDAGISCQTANLSNVISSKNKPALYLKGALHNKKLTNGSKSNYATGRYFKLFKNFINEAKPDLFIWESTVDYHLLLAKVLHDHSIPFIALPHNIESLVSGSKSIFTNKTSPNWLFEEIKYLKYSSKIFTIAREEQWLLNNLNIDTGYLPYYPARACENFLLAIRARKEQVIKKPSSKKNILLLGTFHNKPTADGYLNLIKNISQYQQLIIHVAGYGSEYFKSLFTDDNVYIYGTVSSTDLAGLIINSDYGIVHQSPSSGALTRIPELLLAGLPLLVNEHAARSCHDKNGIKVYSSYAELLEILQVSEPVIPIQAPKPSEGEHLISYIKSFIR